MKYLAFLFYIVLSLSLVSCFGDKEEKAEKSTSESIDEASKGLVGAMKQLEKQVNDGEVVEPIGFREFQKYFPDEVDGYEMSDFGGETTGSMGFSMSVARAKYTKDDKVIEVTITDAGGMGTAMMALAAWSMVTIDKEDSNSLERTGKWEGFKTFEKWDKRYNSSELTLIIEDRLLYNASADDMKLDDLKDFVKDFDPGDFSKAL